MLDKDWDEASQNIISIKDIYNILEKYKHGHTYKITQKDLDNELMRINDNGQIPNSLKSLRKDINRLLSDYQESIK